MNQEVRELVTPKVEVFQTRIFLLQMVLKGPPRYTKGVATLFRPRKGDLCLTGVGRRGGGRCFDFLQDFISEFNVNRVF
jgi:hypothetical protein